VLPTVTLLLQKSQLYAYRLSESFEFLLDKFRKRKTLCKRLHLFLYLLTKTEKIHMAKKQATIQDIATALNITASTVSRAMSDHPKIKKSTKELVWQKAKELFYQPNSIAASLRKGKANTIGMIVPRINRHFFSNVITGVESILNPIGYTLIICQSDETLEKEMQNIKTLIANRVDGILVSTSIETTQTRHFEKALNMTIPLVRFDRVVDEMEVSKVENDDVSGSYDLTRHLLDHGCKSIMWIGGPRTSSIYRNRYAGYRKALAESHIDAMKMPLFEGNNDLPAAKEFFSKYMEKNELPDAIFAASDLMALGVIQVLEAAGLKIPDDIAVAGYSNEPFSAYISPKLTTVDQFSEEIGRAAATLLLDQINADDESFVPRKIIIKPKLIVRESTVKK
jgi:LacI family transcriptional regulator